MTEIPRTHTETTTKICIHDFSLNNWGEETEWFWWGGEVLEFYMDVSAK